MTIEELTEIATDFLRKNYDMELAIPVVRNNRLRTSMGRFVYNYEGEADRIEIAGFMFEYATREVIVDTLKHECIHYALFERSEPNDDGHPHFESELRKHNVLSTKTNCVGLYVLYACNKCGKEEQTRGKRLLKEYHNRVTWCCRAPIRIVGERIYDGTEAV